MPTVLGSGSFGKVQVAYREDDTKKLYAVKIAHVSSGNKEVESSILKHLSHSNIIRFYGSVLDPKTEGIRIFQELAIGGDLFSYLSTCDDFLSPLPESEAIIAIYQITRALDYLHRKGIVHRDLKLDNILVMDVPKSAPKLVLADFGVAKQTKPFPVDEVILSHNDNTGKLRDFYNPGSPDQSNKRRAKEMWMSTIVGTAEYTAPEIDLFDRKLAHQKGYNEKVDTWSLGVIVFIILSGMSPFYSNTLKTTVANVRRGLHYHMQHSRWSSISEDAKTFVTSCLEADLQRRWSIRQCLQSSLFNTGLRGTLIREFLARQDQQKRI